MHLGLKSYPATPIRVEQPTSSILALGATIPSTCMVPKYRAAVDYTPRLRAPQNLPRCTANSDTYRQ